MERWTPTLSEASRGKKFEYIAAGNELTVALTSTGEVYSCGTNEEGQCGIGMNEQRLRIARCTKVLSFTKVFFHKSPFSSNYRISQVYGGNGCEHMTIVTEEGGRLLNCGINCAGQLGRGHTHREPISPYPVERLMCRKVAKVACSYFHSVVMTEGGRDGRGTEIWTFGGNACGQLGQGDKVRRLVPTPIESLRGLDVLSVACGLYHTVISVAGGGMYAWGKNDNGQLGLEDHTWRLSPTRIQGSAAATAVVKQLACGYFHTVGLEDNGQLLAFGRNDFGQLGLGHVLDTREPTRVPLLAKKRIVQVACGSYHTVPLDADGKIYPFGRNNHGQLGTGTNQDSSRPCFVEKLSEKYICQVAAGFYHTVCIISESGVKRRARPLNSDLYGLLGNPSQSDVTFLVEGKAIYGHRCIIGARCEPLGCMLEGSMKEASPEAGSIPLPDHRHDVFLAFLEFLYTDKVMSLGSDSVDAEFALDLLEVADRYLVDDLKQLCEDAIMKSTTTKNAYELLMAADSRSSAASLRERCLQYAAKHKAQLASAKGLKELSPILLAEIAQAVPFVAGADANTASTGSGSTYSQEQPGRP
ncbi:unnamed protein product [Ascophyllum nodosum]